MPKLAETELAALRTYWVAEGCIDPDAPWIAMSGGRTNPVWRLGEGADALVCKLFRQNAATPLFANDPASEALALRALEGSGLAPRLVAAGATPVGESLLYTFVEGSPWRAGVEDVARLLRRLHDLPPPAALAPRPGGAVALLAQGRTILADLGAAGDRLRAIEPRALDAGPFTPVFLHGDPVAGNILRGKAGLSLIDWQCPGIGDACDDLAICLSPAMQLVYAGKPLSEGEEEAFLNAYGKAQTARRYRLLAPVYHWRMAAYCLWKAERGDSDYREAAEREIERIERRS